MGRLFDESGNNNHLDLIGLTYTDGGGTLATLPVLAASTFGAAFGNALDSPGIAIADARIESGLRCRRGAIDLGTGPFTFETYVSFDSVVATQPIALGYDAAVPADEDWYFFWDGPAQRLSLILMQDNGALVVIADPTSLSAATKYYVGCVYDTSTTPPTARVFRGLATDATIPQVAATQLAAGRTRRGTTAGAIFWMGRDNSQAISLNGQWDHSVLWNSAKYGAAGFARPTAPYAFDPGMKAYWNFGAIGGHTSRDRFFRNTIISGTVAQLAAAGSAATSATVAGFTALGAVTVIRFSPGARSTANAPIPSVGTAAANMGWRDSAAQDAVNPIEIHGATWRQRFRYKRGGTALGELDQAAIITAILYRVSSGGTFISEVGRNASGVVTFGTAVLTGEIYFGPLGPVAMAAGDKLQVEAYVTPGVFAVGVFTPGAPLTNEDLILVLDESDANNGTALTPQTQWNGAFTRSDSVTSVGTATMSRLLTLARSFSVTSVGTAAMSRRLTILRAYSVTSVGTAAFSRLLSILRAFTTTSIGTAAMSRRLTILRAYSVTSVGTAAFSRLLTLHRSFSVTSVGTPVFARVIIFSRKFSVTSISQAKMRIEMAQEVINRMVSGGSSIIKKVLYLFDD